MVFNLNDYSWRKRNLPWPGLIAGLLLCAVYLYFFAFKAHVDFSMTMFEPGRTWFKVYWADENSGFSEQNMQRVRVDGKSRKYQLFIGDLDGIKRLRIDPVEYKTSLVLHELTINQAGYAPIELNIANEFKGLRPAKEIGGARAREDGLHFRTTGGDGQFELELDTRYQFPLVHIAAMCAILAFSLLIPRTLGFLARDLDYVPALLLVAVMLSLIMAVISLHYWIHPNGVTRMFVHPDEEVHVAAVKHFQDHLLPPAIDDPAIRDSYSVYGYSRLGSYELYYPVAGYLTRLLAPLRNSYMWDARLVTVLCLALIAWLAWRQVAFRPFALPLLLSPQIWYLYSYTNSDGFALMLAILAAYQAAYPGSTLNRLLTEPRPAGFWFHAAWLGLLAGALLLSKQNFYLFLLFLGLYFLWRLANGDFANHKLFWRRLIVIGLIGLGIYGLRVGLDIAINGPDSKQKQLDMVEATADPLYRPSTELKRKHTSLYMKDRGISLARLINKERWGGKTFISSFGAYGYTEFLGSDIYYTLVKAVGLALLGAFILSILIYGPVRIHWLLGIAVLCIGMLITASLWLSWTVSFQAQGRYLAPVLPMLGVMYFHLRPSIDRRVGDTVINGLVLALFSLGVYSFVFIGLGLVPKFG